MYIRRTVPTPNGFTKVAAVADSVPAHLSSNSKYEANVRSGDGWSLLSLRQSLIIWVTNSSYIICTPKITPR